VQALKAGVMEIPDVIVVNKADHPLAATMVREIRSVLALAPPASWQVPVLRTEATRGEGLAELEDALAAHRAHLVAEGTLMARRRRNLRNEVVELATERWRGALEARLDGDEAFETLLDEVVARRLDPASAARQLSTES
jgi:LAO/AO transport system kinase